MTYLSVDPNFSDKCLVIDMVSYLTTIQGTVIDLINESGCALGRIPFLKTTAREIQS